MGENDQRKNAAFMYADMEVGALGLRSRLGEEIGGEKVLRRTVGRLERVKGLAEILVFCPAGQKGQVERLLAGTKAEVIGLEERLGVNEYGRRRKWGLSSWRGGIREATVYDEQSFSKEMVQVMRDRQVYTAVWAAAAAVLIDPELLEAMLEHHHKFDDTLRFTFSQAAPGLLGGVYRLDLLHEVVQSGRGVSESMAYDPSSAHMDYIIMESNFRVDTVLGASRFRYLADTQRSFAKLGRLWENGSDPDNWDSYKIVEKIEEYRRETDVLPREVEIEINTEPSLRIDGYPHRAEAEWRGGRGEGRGRMSLEGFEKILDDLREYDDVCITIGGFGEPLAHPELVGMIKAAKKAGVFGINIETDGLRLKGEMAEGLLESEADVISVYLDANSEEVYGRVKGLDTVQNGMYDPRILHAGLKEGVGQSGTDGGEGMRAGRPRYLNGVVEEVEGFIERSKGKGKLGPMVVPHLVKTRATMGEMEAFYDRWLKAAGAAVIEGYNDFAGQIEDRAVMDMAPAERYACGRLNSCMTILADGRVTICGQDYKGEQAVGNVFEQSVAEIWRSEALEKLRRAHSEGDYERNGLCGRCREWHR